MTKAVERMMSQAEQLSTSERAELVQQLMSTLEDDSVAEAWRVEIARRVDEIRRGVAVGRPADEVLAEMRERYP